MRSRAYLRLEDFDDFEVWTGDETGDFYVPSELRFFESGELDDDTPIFVRAPVRFEDGSTHLAILGLRDDQEVEGELSIWKWEAYYLEFFKEDERHFVNLALDFDDRSGEAAFCNFFGKGRHKIFPMVIDHEIKGLDYRLEQVIRCGITDIWFRAYSDLLDVAEALGMTGNSYDSENQWEWVLGHRNGVELDITRDYTRNIKESDIRIFRSDLGDFESDELSTIMETLRATYQTEVRCGQWNHYKGEFQLRTVKALTASG